MGRDNEQENEWKLSKVLLIYSSALIISLSVAGWIRKLHILWLPESCVVVTIGIAVGALIRAFEGYGSGTDAQSLAFSSNTFYFGLLPPLIYSCGYHTRRRFFLGNLGAILGLAVLGTLVATSIFAVTWYWLGNMGMVIALSSLECVAFGSLISSTDPVAILAVFSAFKIDIQLFYLVFGERYSTF